MELELWRLDTVVAKTGLSKSELQRRTHGADNPFPRPRKYRGGGRASFWISREVTDWMQREIGAEQVDLAELVA